MRWLTAGSASLGFVAAKAALMYVTALLALRVGERRTLAQWTIIDFATAVALGAIIGRTAIAGTQSYATGAVAVVTLVAFHRAASVVRRHRLLGKLFDHRVRVLLAHGQVRRGQLRRCGLTDNDLYTQLRQRGVFHTEGLRYVLYEAQGTITIVPEDAASTGAAAPAAGDGVSAGADPALVRAGLSGAADFP